MTRERECIPGAGVFSEILALDDENFDFNYYDEYFCSSSAMCKLLSSQTAQKIEVQDSRYKSPCSP